MSLRRLWATTRLDLAHNVRRPLFWIWLLILALTAWGFSGGNMRIQSGDSDVGGVKAFITSEFAIAQIMTVLILLFHAFFIAVGSGMSVLRDEELQVGPVLHATPLSPSEYVWGKFLAVLISFVVVLGLHIGLMAFFNHLMTGAEESEFIGPFVLGNYLRPALIFALPTVVFLAGVTFWVGERFKRPILVFFLPVAMLMACVFFLWSWSPTWLPQSVNRLLMFLDPSGQRWLQETWLKVDKGAEFYNTSAIGLDGVLIWSRLLLVAIGILGVVLASRHFSATLRGKPWRSSRASGDQATALEEALAAQENSGPAQAPVVPAALGALGMRSGRPGFFSGLSAVTSIEFRELIHSPGLYLFIPLIVLETMGGAMLSTGPFDTTPLLTPGTMAVGGMGILTGFVCLLLLFYTVESLRREEGTGLASIHHSTPVRTASILSGKALANALVGVVTIAASLLTSLVIMSIKSSVAIELWPFILVWCVILLPTFLLWSTFVSFLYSLVRNRYTTYALALGAMMWTGYESQTGGLSWVWNWPLWGTLQWSDMGVFELVRGELFFNRLLALTVTVFFTVLTVRLFPRRQSDSTNVLLRLRPLSLLKNTLKLSPVIIPPIVVGVMLAGRIDAGFQGDQRTKAAKDYWRKNVATWTDADIPDLVDVQLELELFPQRRSFEARGTYTLSNEHDHDLAVIPITSGAGWRRPDSLPDPPPGEDVSEAPLWFLDGEPFEPEDAAGLMLFRLPQPLAPGGKLTLGFHHSGEVPSGATENGGGNMEFILPSGVVLGSFSPTIVPGIGYNPGIGVDEDNSSDAKEFPDDHYLGVTRSLFGGTFAPFPVSMRVTAPEEYRINGVGVLKSDEVVDGKRTVVWETDSPVRFFNVVAGRWTEARGKEGTAIYHHPEHTYNIEVMLEALDGARKYYSEWFFPYPWEELKISEFPALAGYAQGFPTNITFSEGIGFLTKEGKEIASAPFMVTAHESAHQWWGNILTPGEGPGGNLLSEGMAHFSTLLLFEQIRGIEARIAFAKMIESQYGDRRVKDSERPLVKIDGSRPGDTTVTYDKAGWVFWMLLNHMGRENCLSGIQSFIAHYESNRDHPLLQDYIAHLRPFAPDAETYDAFVQQWFLDVVVPKYEFEDVEKTGEPESGWTVTLTVTNTGTGVMPVEVVASAGERFPKEEDESTDSGANSQEAVPGPGEVLAAEIEDADEPVYRSASVTVTLGPDESAEVVIECPFEPERVVIDPDALVLMLGRKHAIEEL